MLKNRTIAGIRKHTSPIFLSVPSPDAKVELSAFNDTAHGILFVASSDNDFAYSPLTGEKSPSLSVGETAAGPKMLKSFKAIGKCTKKKCGCTMLTMPDIATMLETANEKQIFCTSCGHEMTLEFDADDANVLEDEGEGDEEIDDEDVVSEDDEEIDDSVGDEDEEIEDEEVASSDDDLDSEIDNLIAEVAAELDEDEEDEPAAEDDDEEVKSEDDSEDEDKALDEEIAALAAEVASAGSDHKPGDDPNGNSPDDKPAEEPVDPPKPASEEEASSKLVRPMHRLSDLSKGTTRVLFTNADTALLMHTGETASERQIGTFRRDRAVPASASVYDNRTVFGRAVSQMVASGGLTEDAPSADLTGLGFEPIEVELPLSAAQTKKTDEAVEVATASLREESKRKLSDISANFGKLLSVATVGLDKGVIEGPSFHRELAQVLHSFGVRKSPEVARKICEGKLKPFLAAAIAKAAELAEKDVNYVTGVAESVARAPYASNQDLDQPAPPATILRDDVNDEADQIEVASVDDYKPTPVTPTRIQNALRQLGRRS